jgi:hypothetical protein
MITVISNWSLAVIVITKVFPLSLLALKTGIKRLLNLLNKGNMIPEIQSRPESFNLATQLTHLVFNLYLQCQNIKCTVHNKVSFSLLI